MSVRATVYGKYSLGSGAIMKDRERLWSSFADPDVVDSYVQSISRDLERAKIPLPALADWHVMDVGSGRQALALLKLGAKRVSHFDLAPENVAAVEAYIGTMAEPERLSTRRCDLVTADLDREQFDFVYLNGIVQHFSDVGRGIVNCVRALKLGGLMWLYFYRSGSFDQFVVNMIRDLVNGTVPADDETMRDYDAYARLFFAPDVKRTYLSSTFMDGIFTRYARCYSIESYLNFTADCGLEPVASSGLDPAEREVDHVVARGAGVLTLRKRHAIDDQGLARAAQRLSPEREVDQLSPEFYRGHPDIQSTVETYRQLRAAARSENVPAALVPLSALRLFAFFMQITKAEGYDARRRHVDLQACLSGMLRMLDEEFGSGRHAG